MDIKLNNTIDSVGDSGQLVSYGKEALLLGRYYVTSVGRKKPTEGYWVYEIETGNYYKLTGDKHDIFNSN